MKNNNSNHHHHHRQRHHHHQYQLLLWLSLLLLLSFFHHYFIVNIIIIIITEPFYLQSEWRSFIRWFCKVCRLCLVLWKCFLSSVTKDGKDRHKLKREKVLMLCLLKSNTHRANPRSTGYRQVADTEQSAYKWCLPSVKKGHRFKSKGQLVFFFSPTERAEMRDQDHLQHQPPPPPDPSPFTPAFSVPAP